MGAFENLEKRYEEYTNTLNETRRKRDEVKKKLEVALLEVKQLKNKLKLHEQDKENIDTALYELDILYKKVNPAEHSSIDSHFKRIMDILKNR